MSAPSPPPPTATTGGAQRPPLQRPQEGRILAGVAAGLADHLGWDVALVRLLIVVATLLTQGVGLLVYLAAALLVPAAEPGAPRPSTTRSGQQVWGRPTAFWFGVALVVVGGWWLLAATPMRFGLLPGVSLGALAPPLLLIGLGLALWVTGDRAAVTGPTPNAGSPATASPPPMPSAAPAPGAAGGRPATAAAPLAPSPPGTSTPPPHDRATPRETVMTTTSHRTPTSPDDATSGASTPGSAGPGTAPGSTPPGPPAPPPTAEGGDDWTPPPAPEREESILGRATVGVLLVTVGLLWTLRLAGVLTIATGQLLAAALLVVGIGLLVGAVRGRGRGLIWLGVILLPFVLVAQVPGNGWASGLPVFTTDGSAAGELRLTPSDMDELQPRYELGAGSIRLDLTELPFDGEQVDLEVSVGAGEIRVIVPDDVDVTAEGSVGIGQVRLVDRSAGGLGVGDVQVRIDADQPRGSIDLDLSAGLGEIRVQQSPARLNEAP